MMKSQSCKIFGLTGESAHGAPPPASASLSWRCGSGF